MTDYELFFTKSSEFIKKYIDNRFNKLDASKHRFRKDSTKYSLYKEFTTDLDLTISGKIIYFSFSTLIVDQSKCVFEFWIKEDLGDGNEEYYIQIDKNSTNCEIILRREIQDSNIDPGEYPVNAFDIYKYFSNCRTSLYYLSKSETVLEVFKNIREDYTKFYRNYLSTCSSEMFSVPMIKDLKEVFPHIVEQFKKSHGYYTYLELLRAESVTEVLTNRKISFKEFFILYGYQLGFTSEYIKGSGNLINQIKNKSIPDSNKFWESLDKIVKEKINDYQKTKEFYIKIQKEFYKGILELKGEIAGKYGIDPSWLGDRKYDPDTGIVSVPRSLPPDLTKPRSNDLKKKDTFKGILEIINKLNQEES